MLRYRLTLTKGAIVEKNVRKHIAGDRRSVRRVSRVTRYGKECRFLRLVIRFLFLFQKKDACLSPRAIAFKSLFVQAYHAANPSILPNVIAHIFRGHVVEYAINQQS